MAELVLGLILIIGVLGFAGLAALFAFVLLPKIQMAFQDTQYPIEIPNWKTRINTIPAFKTSLDEMSAGLETFLNKTIEMKKYDRKKLIEKLNQQRIQFIRPDNEENARYIVDTYGRKIAGDHAGNTIRVVALDSDKLGQTAFFHELGHAAHQLEAKVDYQHEDDEMWQDIVIWCKKAYS